MFIRMSYLFPLILTLNSLSSHFSGKFKVCIVFCALMAILHTRDVVMQGKVTSYWQNHIHSSFQRKLLLIWKGKWRVKEVLVHTIHWRMTRMLYFLACSFLIMSLKDAQIAFLLQKSQTERQTLLYSLTQVLWH